MKASGTILDKEIRNTMFISMALHIFCFSCFTFTFVNKISNSIDLPIDFLGSILKGSDISTKVGPSEGFLSLELVDNFISKQNQGLKIQSYHLMSQKPSHKPQIVFTSKKLSAKFIGVMRESKFNEKEIIAEVEGVKQPPEWQEDLKLKIK